jgi:hypothetical protein
LQSNEAGDTALDIIPVTVRTRAVTRETASKGYDSANNYHVISRRQASDELFKFKTDYIKKGTQFIFTKLFKLTFLLILNGISKTIEFMMLNEY